MADLATLTSRDPVGPQIFFTALN